MTPSTIEIFVSSEKKPDWLSRKIMSNMKCNYSHIGVLLNGLEIWHSIGTGVCCEGVDHFLEDHHFEGLLDITHVVSDRSFALGWLMGNEGKDYSETQYLGFLFPFLRKVSWINDNNRELICSEYVANFMEICTDMRFERDKDFLKPKDVFDYIEKSLKVEK